MPTVYPIVPGHEIVGRVTKVGSAVTRYKPGDPRRSWVHRRLGRHLRPVQGWP
ncbi:MAG TPA: alcohol dehydrogenase catalytic domain-containing protein [Nitrospiraceae bacterium]|nr:alcohol dehydrogenase catalytic domain-containing protein [Nitrospiraceae bacterium]